MKHRTRGVFMEIEMKVKFTNVADLRRFTDALGGWGTIAASTTTFKAKEREQALDKDPLAKMGKSKSTGWNYRQIKKALKMRAAEARMFIAEQVRDGNFVLMWNG